MASLAATVDRQQAEIESLRGELARRPTTEDMASLREAAIRSVAAVEARVAQTERDLNAPHLGELLARAAGPEPVDATSGNAISVLLAAVPRLEARLDAAASRTSLDELAARVRAESAVAHDALDSSKASKTTVAA